MVLMNRSNPTMYEDDKTCVYSDIYSSFRKLVHVKATQDQLQELGGIFQVPEELPSSYWKESSLFQCFNKLHKASWCTRILM
jgi:hypothetical protein